MDLNYSITIYSFIEDSIVKFKTSINIYFMDNNYEEKDSYTGEVITNVKSTSDLHHKLEDLKKIYPCGRMLIEKVFPSMLRRGMIVRVSYELSMILASSETPIELPSKFYEFLGPRGEDRFNLYNQYLIELGYTEGVNDPNFISDFWRVLDTAVGYPQFSSLVAYEDITNELNKWERKDKEVQPVNTSNEDNLLIPQIGTIISKDTIQEVTASGGGRVKKHELEAKTYYNTLEDSNITDDLFSLIFDHYRDIKARDGSPKVLGLKEYNKLQGFRISPKNLPVYVDIKDTSISYGNDEFERSYLGRRLVERLVEEDLIDLSFLQGRGVIES